MATRRNLLLRQATQTRRNALLNVAATAPVKRRHDLLKIIGKIPFMVTHYKNKKGRPIYVTLKGTYIVRQDGVSLYGRKANSCAVPSKIRPKKCKRI